MSAREHVRIYRYIEIQEMYLGRDAKMQVSNDQILVAQLCEVCSMSNNPEDMDSRMNLKKSK